MKKTDPKSLYQFFTKLVVFILIVFAADFILGSIIEAIYYKHHDSRFAKSTYVINHSDEEIIIFGDSRAEHHYVPNLIEKKTKMTCYNAGSDGQSLFYHCALLKGIINRYTPKEVILEIGKDDLYFKQMHYDKLSLINQYYYKNAELRPIIDLKGKSEKYKLLSKLYSYNSSILIILKSFINPKPYSHGYSPIINKHMPKNSNPNIADDPNGHMKLDPNKINILNEIISICKNNNIKLYTFTSPKYGYKKNSNCHSFNEIQKILQENKIPYYDYSFIQEISLSPDLFQDPDHLNNTGADAYSEIITRKLAEIDPSNCDLLANK